MAGLITFALILVAAGAPSLHAATHRPILHPNPNLTIVGITQGPDGWLWLAAEDGLYRFDGFHYRKINQYPFASARFIGTTVDRTVWIGSSEGLTRYTGGSFKISNREPVAGMAVLPRFVFVKTAPAVHRYRLNGASDVISSIAAGRFSPDSSGNLWLWSMRDSRARLVAPEQPDRPLEDILLPGTFDQIVRDSDGRLWGARDDVAVRFTSTGAIVESLSRRHSRRTSRPDPIFHGAGRNSWFLGERLTRLAPKLEFDFHPLGNQSEPTAGYEDPHGRLWVAWLHQGLIEWRPDSAWQRWSTVDLDSAPINQIVASSNRILAATRANLYQLNTSTDSWHPLTASSRDYAAILPLPGGEFLASVRRSGVVRLSAAGEVLERVPDPLLAPDQYRLLFRDPRGAVWVTNKEGLLRLEGKPGALRLQRQSLPGVPLTQTSYPADFQIDRAGRLWVGYLEGIAVLDHAGAWHKIETDKPVREVRSFALRNAPGHDEIWVAYRRPGRFSRLNRDGGRWLVTDFTSTAGFGPPDTHFFKFDRRGWLWRGTPDGVYISDGRHTRPEQWLHINTRNGLSTLATSLYGFLEASDGTVWISGDEGVTRLNPEPSWFTAAPSETPRLSRVEIDGREVFPDSPSSIVAPAGTARMRLELGSFDAPRFRDAVFRYRLQPNPGDWSLARNATIELQGLPLGSYTIEISPLASNSTSVIHVTVGASVRQLGWLWFVPVPLAVLITAIFGPWLPWSERARYHVSKQLFFLRRRLSDNVGTTGVAPDYCGATFLGRYVIDTAISRGGFSTVFKGRDLACASVPIAVKVLSVSPGAQTWVRDRFAHEIAALRTIQHPAVVRVLDSWITPEGDPALAMPYLHGPTLREAIVARSFSPAEALSLASSLADALAEMHSRGIVHRDLKPENIMFAEPACHQPVIIDFGTAGLRARHDQLTNTTLVVGSFQYMAPERLTGHYSPASDLYSLGVILLEMLTGKRLADYQSSPSDESFAHELAACLGSILIPEKAKALADILIPAFDAQPRRRPSDPRAWIAHLSSTLQVN